MQSPAVNDIILSTITKEEQFTEETPRSEIEQFLLEKMQPYNDPPQDITKGLDFALGLNGGLGGFIALAHLEGELAGVLVMLRTGMSGYIPANLLLYVGVDPEKRGNGIGGKLIDYSIAQCEGDVKLHVDHGNPATHLYERIGFVNRYAEMRLKR